jgi:hypothetical protein
MSPAHVVAGPAPAVAHAGGLHTVAPETSSAEREANRFAESFVSGAPGWSFADHPVHAAPGDDVSLEPGLQARLGAALGTDVSDVRLHDGPEAADLAKRARADAVTIGQDISFAPDKRAARSRDGVRRLAHEVAHAVKHADHGLALRDGSGPAAAATTLAGLPEADRKAIQVVTTTPVPTPDKDKLKSVFEATSISSPADAVTADSSVPTSVSRGLVNLAGEWSSGADAPLVSNSTFTVELDLTSRGGPKGLFRFTYTSPPAKKGATATSRIIIEALGAAKQPADVDKPVETTKGEAVPPDPIAGKLKAASITFSGYKASEEPALRAAISQVPASHLGLVKGLRFKREPTHPTKASAAGDYDQKTHTITMFDNAFTESAVKVTEGGVATSAAARYIVHEIGHAVDLRDLAKAHDEVTAASAAVTAASGKFANAEEKARYDDAVKAETAAKKALRDIRSRSGSKTVEKSPGNFEDVVGKGHKGVPFREAVKKDGKDVSKYAEDDWQESYAEAYSLYLTSGSQLKLLRPATYDYLDKNLPK